MPEVEALLGMPRKCLQGVLFVVLLPYFMGTYDAAAREVRRKRPQHGAAKAVAAKSEPAAIPPIVTPPPTAPLPAHAPPSPVPPPAGCDEACQQGRSGVAILKKLAWASGGLVLVSLFHVLSLVFLGVLVRRTRENVHEQAGWMKNLAGSLKEQSEILRGSVAAAQASADAATRQISHAVASERPWMDVQLSQKDLVYSQLKFIAKNRGNFPARILMYTVEKVVISSDDADSGPKYGSTGRFDEVQWRLAGDEFMLGEFQLPSDLSSQVRQPGVSSLYQGFIRYNDTLTEDVHETRFCYEACGEEHGPVRFRMFHAKGYNTMI